MLDGASGGAAARRPVRGGPGADSHGDEDMVRINGERLLADLHALREFGRIGTGVVRQALSDVDMESRRWLVERMREADLDAGIDGLGTVLGRSRAAGKALLIGSHTDTQPTGGWLDGAMGVMYGLEVARAFREHDETRDFALDVASWIDEEGAFFGCLGSQAFCGMVNEDTLDTATAGPCGARLADALREAGLEGRPWARLSPGRYAGYLEAHIEQGPYLEEENKRIGIVTSIVGIRNFLVTFKGQQNHAGTTPMPRRRDAATALIDLAHTVNRRFPERAGPKTVWTIGQIDVFPGAPSIVPGAAWMNVQFRDGEEARLDALSALLREMVAEADAAAEVGITMREGGDLVAAAAMDEGFQAHLARAAEVHAPGAWMHMPSAAGHDAQVIARRMPSAMLFVPSIGGISHAFEEDTAEEDVVLGCQVFAAAAAAILAEEQRG